MAVMSAEAYVLFYRKVNDKVDPARSELQRLLAEAQIHPGLMQFYVSKQWFNKFENFAEPGNLHSVLKLFIY
jgi:ubiquitin carboxyl-terminal hydrolase 20/33